MESQNPNLTCIICFDTFRVPVTIPCGHTFCEKCITRHWDTQSKSDVPAQCPVCNKKFLNRPVLNRNVNLAVMTEAADSPSSAGGEPVSRDGGGATAILCHLHNMPLVYYCKQDKMGVCIKCGVSNCNSHQKVLLETERETQGLLLKSKSAEVEKLIKENDRSIGVLTENIEKAKVSLKQTSIWLDSKFCSLKEALDEKQETTNHFIERKNLGDLAQAEARLTQLRERAQELRQSQHRIEELHHLPDSELIKESTLVRVPSFKEFPVDMMPNLQERLNGITEVLSRVSKLVTEDLEKAVSAVVGQDKQGSPQDKRPVLAVVPSPAARCHPGGKEGLNASPGGAHTPPGLYCRGWLKTGPIGVIAITMNNSFDTASWRTSPHLWLPGRDLCQAWIHGDPPAGQERVHQGKVFPTNVGCLCLWAAKELSESRKRRREEKKLQVVPGGWSYTISPTSAWQICSPVCPWLSPSPDIS